MAVVLEFIGLGMAKQEALRIAGITKHQFYYKQKKTKQGRKQTTATTQVINSKQIIVSDIDIIAVIKEVKSDVDLDYGYIKMTAELQHRGYLINKKKVYRIMFEHKLLKHKVKFEGKQYVKYRQVIAQAPLTLLAIDLKMVWIPAINKHGYILSIIDAFTRYILYHNVELSIKQNDVRDAWESVIVNHLQANNCIDKPLTIEIRNDNDKRFSAKMVQNYLRENKLSQVFSHPYTPQDNGYIESFHKILGKHLDASNYWSLHDLKLGLKIFYDKYNTIRLHSSIGNRTPLNFWNEFNENKILVLCNIKTRKMKVEENTNDCLNLKYTQVIKSKNEESGLINLSRRDANKNRQNELPINNQGASQYKLSQSLESGFIKIDEKLLTLQHS
jgi:transposase InsO family protein